MRVLIDNSKKYVGKFVAIENFNTTKVIASGDSFDTVMLMARNNGCRDAVVFYVSKEGEAVRSYASNKDKTK